MRLLERALERDLLGDGDYMVKADALRQAGDIEQMNVIVQQLPVLETPANPKQTRSGGERRRLSAPPVQSQLPVQSRLPAQMPTQMPEQKFYESDDLSGLDPVDIAMLTRSRQVPKAPSGNRRYVAIAVVGIIFLVLVVLGLYLASHESAVNGSNGLSPPPHLSASTVRII